MTNRCVYDCKYCVNRRSNEAQRAMPSPRRSWRTSPSSFYRRNYIEGLFLSSGVLTRSPDYTTELMIRALRILREEYRFNGYIHAKAIPGAAPELVRAAGPAGGPAERQHRAARQRQDFGPLAPDKTKAGHPGPHGPDPGCAVSQSREELVKYRHAPRFAPAGQSTQMIVGATPDSGPAHPAR